jgi:hypothetical protein
MDKQMACFASGGAFAITVVVAVGIPQQASVNVFQRGIQ